MKRFWILISIIWLATCGGGGSSPTEPEPPKLPTVTNLDLETAEDTALNFTLQGTEPSGLSLTYAFSSTPSNGQVTLNGAQATYNPNANYNGTDTFGYIATSTSGSSTVGVISITITPVDDEPSTMDANATTDEDNAVDITFDVTEVDGQDVTFSVTNNPSNGSVAISGSVATYTPNQDWNGTDQFNFQVEDASAKRILNTATATIIVNPVNDAPTVENVTAQMDENKVDGRYQPVTITLAGADVDGDNLSYAIIDNPSNGTVQADGTATVIYTPNQDYNGEDTFTYKANDGTVDSDKNATVTVTINAIDDVPVVSNVNESTDEDTALTITLPETDVDNQSLTYTIISNVSNGSAVIAGNQVTYTPSANYNGTDTFTFKANDGTNDSNIATATFTINPVNDAPEVTADAYSIEKNNSKVITLNGTDIDGDDLSFEITTDPTNGSATINDDKLIYTPNTNYVGSDNVSFRAYDGSEYSNNASLDLNVSNSDIINLYNTTSMKFEADDYIKFTHEGGFGDFYFSAWFKSDCSESDQQFIFSKKYPSNAISFYMKIEGSVIKAGFYDENSDGGINLSGGEIQCNEWQFVQFWDRASKISIALNGVIKSEQRNNSGWTISNKGRSTFMIGNQESGSKFPNEYGFSGLIDQIVLFASSPDLSWLDDYYNSGQGIAPYYNLHLMPAIFEFENDVDNLSPNTGDGGFEFVRFGGDYTNGWGDSGNAEPSYSNDVVSNYYIGSIKSLTLNEDTSIDISLDGFDFPSGSNLSISLINNPNNGSVQIDGDVATYTPNTDYNGQDDFGILFSNGNEFSSMIVKLTIFPVAGR